MGERNNAACNYLGRKEIFADFVNGTLFEGRQEVLAENLEYSDKDYLPVRAGKRKEKSPSRDTDRYRDVLMKDKDGTKYAIVGIEAQSKVHYAMPIRTMEYDVLEYRRQLQELKRNFRKDNYKNVTSEEYLSGMHKTDKLKPVITLTFYHGKEDYDGCKDLHDLIEWNAKTIKYKALVENYHLNLITLKDMKEENFQTGLRELVGFLKRSEDKDALREYCNENAERFRQLDEETYHTICIMAGQQDMLKYKTENTEEGGIDMCKAIMDIKEEGWKEGREEGRKEGCEEGSCLKLISQICRKLQKGKSPVQIAEDLEENILTVENICRIANQYISDYDCNVIYQKWKEQAL